MSISSSKSSTLRSTRKLATAYYSPGWPPDTYSNGIISYVASIVAALRDLGHRAYVLAHIEDESRVQGTNRQDFLSLTGNKHEKGCSRLLKAGLAKIRPEVVWSEDFAASVERRLTPLINAAELDLLEIEESFGLPYFLRLPLPVVVRLHGPWFLNGTAVGAKDDGLFARRIRREGRSIANAFAVTAPSQNVLNQTRSYYDLPLDKAVVIPCPVPATPQDQRWRSATCDPNLIAFIGRFDRHKGGDLVIDAFAQILKELPEARLHFAGRDDGYVDDQGYKWRMEEYVQKRLPGALETGKIKWLGQQPPAALRELRRRAQVTVIASRYDNFPYTALEASSMGCPIVAAQAGGIPEIVTDESTGLLFQSGNANALAAQVLRLLKNPALAAYLGSQAGEECAKRFSPEAVAKQSIDFYEETLDRWLYAKS